MSQKRIMNRRGPLRKVDCGRHGKRMAAILCKHQTPGWGTPAGFVEMSNDTNNLQAWCYACEETFQREGGMTSTFLKFNSFVLVCVVCYAKAKAHHSLLGSKAMH